MEKRILEIIRAIICIILLISFTILPKTKVKAETMSTFSFSLNQNFNIAKNRIISFSKNNYQEKVILDNIISYNQFPEYPTGCESVAAYVLLKYYNVNVTIDEIINNLPKGAKPYNKKGINYGANPEKEFVGNPKDKKSYGVYNVPIAETINNFKKGAIAENQVSTQKLKNIIKNGNPVIAWININGFGNSKLKSKFWYDYKTKEKVLWISGEHAVVVYGFDEDNFYISDSNTGTKYAISNESFLEKFDSMNRRIVYYEKNS